MSRVSIAIFASGTGSNCENIIRYFQDSATVRTSLVVSNKSDAPVLDKAQRLGVATKVVNKAELNDEQVMMPLLRKHNVQFIVLAGFLPLIPDFMVAAFDHRMINLHPSLLPKYGGKGMWGHHVHEAVKTAGDKETGMTVHWVTPVCDGGDIIAQFRCQLSPDDTADDIAAKEHLLEMQHFPKVIEQLLKEVIN